MYAIRILIVLLTSLALSACANLPGRNGEAVAEPESPPAEQAAATTVAPDSQQYRIGPDDQLQVNVWRNPELSVSVPVRPDGMITVPLIGDVEAGGKTTEEVAANIEDGLDKYLRSPRVAVIVTDLRSDDYSSRIRVTGAVENPVSIPYRQGMTVLDAVLEAGGLTEFAAANRAKLYRRSEGDTGVRQVRLRDILEGGELDTNVALKPGDVVTVPERLF